MRKRLIAVLTWKDSCLVRSVRYSVYRPSISLEVALKTLDRWQVDEIVLLDISRRGFISTQLIDALRKIHVRTPLAVGGGIRTVDDIKELLCVGCDRFVVESVLLTNPDRCKEITRFVGRQALIGSLPLSNLDGNFQLWGREKFHFSALKRSVANWFDEGLVSELFVTSVSSDGRPGQFPLSIAENFEFLPNNSVIWFGGIDATLSIDLLEAPQTAGIGFGTLLFDSECSMAHIRGTLIRSNNGASIRRTRPQ